jgi:hypothetical protein
VLFSLSLFLSQKPSVIICCSAKCMRLASFVRARCSPQAKAGARVYSDSMLGLCRIWISLAPGHLNIRSSRDFSSIKKSLEQRAELNLLPEASHVFGGHFLLLITKGVCFSRVKAMKFSNMIKALKSFCTKKLPKSGTNIFHFITNTNNTKEKNV